MEIKYEKTCLKCGNLFEAERNIQKYCTKRCQRQVATSKYGLAHREQITERQKQYRLNNPEIKKESSKKWRVNNPELAAKVAGKWAKENPEKRRAWEWRKNGISDIDKANEIYCSEHICAICGTKDGLFRIDHDHNTGRVRGMLCHKCNIGLGCFDDNIELLTKSIKYLEEK